MRFDSIAELQQAVIRCPLGCPYRNEAPGYFPKPPRGPDNSKVMIVFENPGSPDARNTAQYGNPEMSYTVENITLEDALRMCIQGQEAWLFRSNQLDKQKWDDAGFVIGKTVYTTDSHKCPNPKDPSKSKQKEQARKLCLAYLREEIRLLRPKAIIAFGDCARRSVEELEGVKWRGALKGMANDKRVQIAEGRLYAVLPHPDGLWRYPTMTRKDFEAAIGFVFAEVMGFLSKASATEEGATADSPRD